MNGIENGKIRILSFGEIIWDVCRDGRTLGGAPLNFAAHSAKCGAESYILSAVGEDAYGAEARRIIEALGVRTDFLGMNTHPTGRCDVTLGAGGIPRYEITRDTAYDNVTLSESALGKVASLQFDVLYFGTLMQRSPTSRAVLEQICDQVSFGDIVCDVNLRDGCYNADTASYCLEKATILKISDEEEPRLREMGLYDTSDASPEAVAESVCRHYPNIKILLLTMGENGSAAYCAETKKLRITPAVKTEVVSTVGAGDSYLAAWCCSYLRGVDIETACKTASALSAFVVSRKEAVPDYSAPSVR